jgi:hypothetical protein
MAAIVERIEGIDFTLDFEFEESAPEWDKSNGTFYAGPFEATLQRETTEPGLTTLLWRVRRTDGREVVLRRLTIDYQIPLVGLYRLWPTNGIASNRVFVDLPWTIDALSSAASYDPVILGLNSDGVNTCTVGFANTAIETRMVGKMGRRSPEAEAGFTSHVYSLRFERPCVPGVVQRGEFLSDGIFVSRLVESWFDTLGRYAAFVDARRRFQGHTVRERALLPMWHSWYAFENEIDQKNVQGQIAPARELGFGSFQLDAGWNTGRDWVADEGQYEPNRERFPDFEQVMTEIKTAGLVPVAHWSPPWLGKRAPNRGALEPAIQRAGSNSASHRHAAVDHLCPRTPATFDHIVGSARHMVADLGFGGLWYDFIDSLPVDTPCDADHEHRFATSGEAWDSILSACANAAWEADPDCLLIFRRSHANIHNKPYLTHLWPGDAPFDFDKNRREVVVMRAYGQGVLTHACCTCWAPQETDQVVARHLASVVLAGVPAVSIDLLKFPESHLEGIKNWLRFYAQHRHELMEGALRPLMFMPPSAVVRVEGPQTAFVGYFEGLPGVTPLSRNFDNLYLINCYGPTLHTLLPSLHGRFVVETFDHFLRPLDTKSGSVEANASGLHLLLHTPAPAVVHLRRTE